MSCCPTQRADADCLQLTDRELLVCETVCRSPEPLGFSQVRRSVGLHQEILSRILKRLTIHGALERKEGKYMRRVVSS